MEQQEQGCGVISAELDKLNGYRSYLKSSNNESSLITLRLEGTKPCSNCFLDPISRKWICTDTHHNPVLFPRGSASLALIDPETNLYKLRSECK